MDSHKSRAKTFCPNSSDQVRERGSPNPTIASQKKKNGSWIDIWGHLFAGVSIAWISGRGGVLKGAANDHPIILSGSSLPTRQWLPPARNLWRPPASKYLQISNKLPPPATLLLLLTDIDVGMLINAPNWAGETRIALLIKSVPFVHELVSTTNSHFGKNASACSN